MRKIIFTMFMLMACTAAQAAGADEITGTWSNGGDGTAKAGFALRKDGRGTFTSSAAQSPVRWTNTADGIQLKIAKDGTTTEMVLRWNAEKKALTTAGTDGATNTFIRGDNVEPPDLESEMEAKRRQDAKSFDARAQDARKEEYNKAEDLVARVRECMQQTGGGAGAISWSGRSDSIRFSSSKGRVYGSALILHKLNEIPGMLKLYGPWNKGVPDNLPTVYEMEKDRLSRLKGRLDENGIKYKDVDTAARGVSEVYGFMRTLSFELKSDDAVLPELVHFMLVDLYSDCKPPYYFLTMQRAK